MKARDVAACLPVLAAALLPGCAWLKSMAPGPATAAAASIYSSKPWFVEEGIASWYGGRWIGRLTANGERYRAGDMTAAHKKLPFNTRVRVTDLKTGNQVIVRINNRGPFIRGRIIDLSTTAAKQLGTYSRGIAKVRIEALREIPKAGPPNLSTADLRQKKSRPGPRPGGLFDPPDHGVRTPAQEPDLAGQLGAIRRKDEQGREPLDFELSGQSPVAGLDVTVLGPLPWKIQFDENNLFTGKFFEFLFREDFGLHHFAGRAPIRAGEFEDDRFVGGLGGLEDGVEAFGGLGAGGSGGEEDEGGGGSKEWSGFHRRI